MSFRKPDVDMQIQYHEGELKRLRAEKESRSKEIAYAGMTPKEQNLFLRRGPFRKAWGMLRRGGSTLYGLVTELCHFVIWVLARPWPHPPDDERDLDFEPPAQLNGRSELVKRNGRYVIRRMG